MGACQGKGYLQEEATMAQISEFIGCVTHGDVTNLRFYLEEKKQDPNAKDRFGMTALHWACYSGKMHCIEILLQHGATLDALDQNGRNALHHACRKDQDQIVLFLLEQKKFDPNSLSQSKETPLHKAIRGKAIRTLKILLHFGADPTLKNDQNRTPLEELDVNESLLNTRSVDKVEEEQKVCTDEIEQEAFFHRRSKTFSSDQIISFMPRPTTFNTDTTIETTQVQRFTASERNLNSDTRSSHIVGAATASATIAIAIAQKKSFKYFAKLLIRMTRVKNILSHEEKEKLIRLLLEEAIRKKRRQAELIENADENFNKTTTNCTTTTPTDTNPSRLAALGIIRSNSHRKYIIAN